jgi:hypothetical protein
MKLGSYFSICKQLVYADLTVFKQTIVDKFIDVTIWVVLTMIVTSYIMPYFGLSRDFGVFQLGGIIAAIGLFELYSSVVEFVSDMEGNREINYRLTLPMPSWMVFLSKSIYFCIIYSVLSILMLPIGKLTLWAQFDLTKIDYFKFFIGVLCQNLFYSCFVLWCASIIANMNKMGSVWARYIFPMWFMGGFQFSWTALHHVLPLIAYVNLLNPMIYCTESMRVALLGQEGYINFWICIAAMIFFSTVCFMVGIGTLKRRLDFV